MKYNYDIAILGAGSAGLVVAAGSAALGAKVLLIENDLMGGDCLNYGCVPSKSFLHAAHLAGRMKSADKYGVFAENQTADVSRLMAYVKSVVDGIAPHDSVERFESLGVDVRLGNASFADSHTLVLNGEKLSAKSIVIATGSTAFVADIGGLAGLPYYTNHNIFKMEKLPKSLAVLGGGPIGLELGQGFSNLGVKVHIIDRNERLFNKDEPEVFSVMENSLKADGVKLYLGSSVEKIEKTELGVKIHCKKDDESFTVKAQELLVSMGRVPNSKNLGLEKVGVKLNRHGYVQTDDRLQTSVKNIYACGDITGPYQFTHSAGYQAGVVVQNALFGLSAKASYSNIAWCTYTSPEVAHVGVLEKEAVEKGLQIETIFISMGENDRARAEEDTDGFLKLILDKKGTVIGATMVAEHAGELISTAALAVSARQNISVFNSVMLPYPTKAEIYKKAASEYRKKHVTPWQKNLLKFLIHRRNKR